VERIESDRVLGGGSGNLQRYRRVDVWVSSTCRLVPTGANDQKLAIHGDGVEFNYWYVPRLTLSSPAGFGDFTPNKPASKVIFIVYALMAVPIVTSFAVQTISGLVSPFACLRKVGSDIQLSTYSERRARRHYYHRARHLAPSAFDTHIEYIAKAHQVYKDVRASLVGGPDPHNVTSLVKPTSDAERLTGTDKNTNVYSEKLQEDKAAGTVVASSITMSSDADSIHPDENLEDTQRELMRRMMRLVVQMETEARDLLLESMEHGIARTLLLADRNGQFGLFFPCLL
jgi:potassium channel subfamily K